MLRFISTGSAFNTVLGNNSAYLGGGKTLVLFDCGGSVFGSLVRGGLLAARQDIFVVITHTHPDHIGSLGDLVLYCRYKSPARVTMVYKHPEIVDAIMEAMGVDREYYRFLNPADGDRFVIPGPDGGWELEAIAVEHSEKVFPYGYVVTATGDHRSFYYSGDASTIPPQVVAAFLEGSIHRLYQDVSGSEAEGNPHLSYDRLCQLIPAEMRSRVCCMHLDENFDIRAAERDGFTVARSSL